MQHELKQAILKCALGFSLTETVEEFGVEEGQLRLMKRKEVKKDIPPDLKAVQLLLTDDYSTYSDQELMAERERLIAAWAAKEGLH